jgi:hypothetical protein
MARELARGTAVIVREGSPLRNRFGLVAHANADGTYAVRVAQPGGGWRSVSFERRELRLPAGGRARRKRR